MPDKGGIAERQGQKPLSFFVVDGGLKSRRVYAGAQMALPQSVMMIANPAVLMNKITMKGNEVCTFV